MAQFLDRFPLLNLLQTKSRFPTGPLDQLTVESGKGIVVDSNISLTGSDSHISARKKQSVTTAYDLHISKVWKCIPGERGFTSDLDDNMFVCRQ